MATTSFVNSRRYKGWICRTPHPSSPLSLQKSCISTSERHFCDLKRTSMLPCHLYVRIESKEKKMIGLLMLMLHSPGITNAGTVTRKDTRFCFEY